MRAGFAPLLVMAFLGALWGCTSPHKVLVLYDRPGALKPGDRVVWENQAIGSVENFRANPTGKTIVPLQIKPDFRPALTDQSRFSIQADPEHPGNQSVRMVLLSSTGKLLPDGAVVEGSTAFSILMEKENGGLQGFPQILQDALDLLGEQMGRLTDREWQKELESQLDRWTRNLERSGEETHRYFQKEVLPKLERAVEDLLRQLRELGKEGDGKAMEEKFEDLKRSLHP